jgi:low temperature requirement protein LtrA
MPLITVVLILIGVGFGLWLVNQIEAIDSKIRKIINGVVILVVVLWLLSLFFPGLYNFRVQPLR